MLLVANGLTNSEMYSRISCNTYIFVVFADERLTTIWKSCTIYKILQIINITVSNKVITFSLAY